MNEQCSHRVETSQLMRNRESEREDRETERDIYIYIYISVCTTYKSSGSQMLRRTVAFLKKEPILVFRIAFLQNTSIRLLL